MIIISKEQNKYLKKIRNEKIFIIFWKIFILIFFLSLWELLAHYKIINTFLSSSPSGILSTIIDLYKNNNLLLHIYTTTYETVLSFSLATIIGIFIASLLWASPKIAKILDPYLTVLNSLPKVSLGPLIIIISGANQKSIIIMALLISTFTTIINMYNAFMSTDENKIFLMQSFHATKFQIFKKLVFRGNIPSLINTLKINISMSLIGVIMGELLVSKQGLGYLITLGSQTFNLNLIITSIVLLALLSYLLYIIVDKIQKNIEK